ncbi:ATP-binding protein [Streptomyces sp. NBC_01340]|uniref:ATP-binding protein n=1 Tax=unclassified Streptomyces TaxID=2593676 RepID=UPI00225109CC|nr:MULTISPECIES: ATP-binding protein [unclassified Streptomyces]MCX4457255.1 ATP-binding protein [Streptomyces sp. NBC_01719]MCX4496612.1 ATP-binding protein [Streptomyces sp. NBC_01728]WSI41515.1 ATP-binding protein [Streptomyces sp. NBC_01340]
MTGSTEDYAPHPHIGGRAAALRALAAWRGAVPGAPRVVVLTGSSGSGRSRLLTGFLMLCEPEFRKRLPLDEMDPSTVPPELPAPAVPAPDGLTAAQVLWLLADHYELNATSTEDVYAELAALDEPVTVVVPDVDRAGPVRAAGEPTRLVREVLAPLAATETVRLLAEVPRPLAAELAADLPPGTAQIIDLDAPEWADPEGLVRHAQAALNPEFGAPELPFTVDPAARLALGAAIGRRAETSPLVVQLAVHCILMAPEGFDPADESQLPTSVGEALDLHARRLGSDPQTLRLILAPLALAEADGIPAHLWARLASAVAGQDMSRAVAGGMLLAGPFVQPEEQPAEEAGQEDGTRTLLRLLHPALGDEIRAGLPNVRAAQTQIAMALLETVPEQDWSKADPYVRDHIAGHTLGAGLLPQLLTDPGLFVHADPVPLRAAIEAVPTEELGAPARTYLRTAPLLTRTQAPAALRAALLETAYVEDGLPDYAYAVHHRLGLDLPWQTLWSLPVPGISAVTVGSLPRPEGPTIPVAVLVVPADTPGAHPVGEPEDAARSAVLVHGLVGADDLGDTDPGLVLRPSEEERAAAPLGLSRGADYLRVWDRASEEVVAALISDVPFTAADLSPDGILLLATERGAKALRIRPTDPAIAS